jgi:hypothetical protein
LEDDQTGDAYSVSPLVTTMGIALSNSEKAETLADNLETRFQPVTVPSLSAVTEMVEVALRPYFMTPVSEPKLTNPDEVPEAFMGLKSARLRARTVSRTEP